jgi:hypothetical protein
MDKQLIATLELIESGDAKKLLRGIEQTSRFPEPIALGFFALARRQAQANPSLDAEAIEATIAATGRAGLNAAQVAQQLAAHMNQRSGLSETQYTVYSALLAAVRPAGRLPALRQHGVIQLDALSEHVRRDAAPEARRALARGLYDWRGRPRPDTSALGETLPFLRLVLERYRRRSVFAYPAALLSNMKSAFAEARASAGFFLVLLLVAAVILTVTLVETFAARPAVPGDNASRQPSPAAPTLAETLAKELARETIAARFRGASVFVLEDDDAPAVLSVLSRYCEGRVFAAPGPWGDPRLPTVALQRRLGLGATTQPPRQTAGSILVACFVRTKHGKQLWIVRLENREIVLALP